MLVGVRGRILPAYMCTADILRPRRQPCRPGGTPFQLRIQRMRVQAFLDRCSCGSGRGKSISRTLKLRSGEVFMSDATRQLTAPLRNEEWAKCLEWGPCPKKLLPRLQFLGGT